MTNYICSPKLTDTLAFSNKISLSILNWIIQTNKMIFYLIFYVVLYDMATPAPCLSIYATSPCFSQQHRVVYVIKVCPERTGCPKILQPLSLSNFLAISWQTKHLEECFIVIIIDLPLYIIKLTCTLSMGAFYLKHLF